MELFKSRTRVAYTNAVGDKVYPVVVDIKKGIKSTEDIQFVSSDVNTGILSVAFISGNENFNVSGADVVCSVMRPDASTLELPCEVVRENIVEVPLGINGTSQDGVYSFDFKVLKGGNKVVGTPIMNYSVSLSIGNDMVVEEDDRLPVLTMLITRVNELKDETSDTINQANVATEASKVATANAIEATNNANAVSVRVSQETATAISEIKQDTENAIASMNQNTSSAISTMNQSATDAISSMEQSATNAIANMTQKTNEAVTTVNENLANINNVVTTKVAELDNAKSDMTTTVTNKIDEVENRFNALTASQQQSSEIIDARDGETSLKARLDRDIEKAKQVYVNVEGSHISTDSSVGYLKDIEILGNTIQSASNLADIKSVGDKVEGQELYEIPVVSCGKNLANPNNFEPSSYITSDGFGNYTIVKTGAGLFIPLLNNLNLKGSTYIIKVETLSGVYTGGNILFYGLDGIKFGEHTANGLNSTATITTTTGLNAIKLYGVNGNATFRIQISENNITEYEPYQEDKLTILSPTPLEKVGDVADRIICKDGVWGVEKNVGTFNDFLNCTLNVWGGQNTDTGIAFYITSDLHNQNVNAIVSNKFLYDDPASNKNNFVGNSYRTYILRGRVPKDGLSSENATGIKEYLHSIGAYVKYVVAQPQFIPLPHDQQIKLRTFANKTNISFLTEIEGTIKAQVPKSLGATVNTHTEQINNLNKELDRVKKLEESTVSTVTTESDFTTVEATSNGYFEDVKLEGKTLVNLISTTRSYISSDNTEIHKDVNIDMTTNKILTIQGKANKVILLEVRLDGLFSKNIICTPVDGFINTKIVLSSGENIRRIKGISVHGWNPSEESFLFNDNFILLEGDHTQNPPSGYIEGLKSVGDGADEIVVSSVNKLGYRKNIAIAGTSPYGIASNGVSYILEDIEIGNLVVNNFKNSERMIVATYDSLEFDAPAIERFDLPKTIGKQVVKINQKAKFALLYLSPTYNETTKGYIYQERDKKRLLYYNTETQAWEKPILREWDSIEKHADGKYYYHQRSGEVVLNGSENWGLNAGWSGEEMSTNSYYLTADGQKTAGLMIKSNGATNIISEVMPTVFINSTSFDSDCVSGENYSSAIYIRINKSKVLNGIKPYLQQNPMRVVYQLAEEKVYECTNIDLITYANETNYVVESGAIAPKSILKVHNNISNVVKILQEKVSLLENKFIEGLKKVLAGDMYSLAELLYPEDFVEEDSEDKIMLLPFE